MSHAKAEQKFGALRTQRIDSWVWSVQVVQAAPLEAVVEASLALSVPPAGQIWRSYYYSGSLRIAVRETTSTSSTVHFLRSDHLGSTVSGGGQQRAGGDAALLGLGRNPLGRWAADQLPIYGAV